MRNKKTIHKILKLKDTRKREIEIEVKKASDRVDEEHAKLGELEQDYENTFSYFTEKHEDGTLDVSNLIACYDFFSRINGKIREQKEVHVQSQRELTCLKDNLVNAHKEKKVFELMKNRVVRKEHKERLDTEQKENDFITLSRRHK